MRLACLEINSKGIVLSKSLVTKTVHKYNGLLGRSLFKLYDWGYQSSPSVFDIIEFREALYSDFKDDIVLLRNNLTGKLEFDDEFMVKFAITKSSNPEFKSAMRIYLDILTAQKALDAYNLLLARVRVPKRSDVIRVKPRLGVNGKVSNENILPLDNSAIRESFVLEDDEVLVKFDTSEVLIKETFKNLGYTDEDYILHKQTGQPFFIRGIAQEDEIALAPVIISGKIITDGKYGKELEESIAKYYSEFFSSHTTRVHCVEHETVIFNLALDERLKLIAEKRKTLGEFREFYVTSTEIIFAVKTSSIKKSYFKDNTLDLGVVVLSHDSRRELAKLNVLRGLSGEFIHEDVVRDKGYITEGLPIDIQFGIISGKSFRLSNFNYYPLYNVYYQNKDGSKGANISPLLGVDIHIIVSDINDIFKKFEVSSVRELFSSVLEYVDVVTPVGVLEYTYKNLVADLTVALILVECGETKYTLLGSNYDSINDLIFYQASIEAESLFRSFGF